MTDARINITALVQAYNSIFGSPKLWHRWRRWKPECVTAGSCQLCL